MFVVLLLLVLFVCFWLLHTAPKRGSNFPTFEKNRFIASAERTPRGSQLRRNAKRAICFWLLIWLERVEFFLDVGKGCEHIVVLSIYTSALLSRDARPIAIPPSIPSKRRERILV